MHREFRCSSSPDAIAFLERATATAREIGPLHGTISYDLGRAFEKLPTRGVDDLALPLAHFTTTTSPAIESSAVGSSTFLDSTFSRDAYLSAVGRCLNYISAGDVFQINLSQRLRFRTTLSAGEILLRLQGTPAPFARLLDFGDYAVICHSPELFFNVENLPDGRWRIVNRPIKGTRPRRDGMADELRLSEKDQAELAMIVDLQRNDLGRVCEIGSVRVTEPRVIEAHAGVYHGVATIEGILREDIGLLDILRATFPCGSITGCPKIRAMEIIEELEPVRRGPYCGAVGTIFPDGSMQFAVAIRTIVLKDGIAHLAVGGGIVADSSPEAEYEETLTKARPMLDALGIQLP